jgi:glycerol kinase
MPLAVAVDLGSSRIKAAHLQADGQLTNLVAAEAPPLSGRGGVRQGNALDYLETAEAVLREALGSCNADVPVAIAAQRSSFLLWETATGRPVTPLISWQDRRAQAWCDAHAELYRPLAAVTGLPLSAHYAGAKLADLLSRDHRLKAEAANDRILFGTLESYLIWRLTDRGRHQTDLSMAGRTLLADIRQGAWASRMLVFFDLPGRFLPQIVPTSGHRIPLSCGGMLAASLADQAAGLIAADPRAGRTIAVNLGTGGFVMAGTGRDMARLSGYLTAPVRQRPDGGVDYALEGTINAIGPALADHPGPDPVLGQEDPAPDGYCLPDSAGLGAPYWRADIDLPFSRAARDCPPELRRRVIMEGIIFRVCRMAEDFQKIRPFTRLLLSGGLSGQSFITQGLAACSGLDVSAGLEPEATLLGAAALAAARPMRPPAAETVTCPAGRGRYLKAKFQRWKTWMDGIPGTGMADMTGITDTHRA